jgi:hypothetical protein
VVHKVLNGYFCVKFQVWSKIDGFDWILVLFYGATQDEKKPEFLSKLVHTCDNKTLSLLIGGILISFGVKRRKTMIILIHDGHSCSMLS